MSSEVLDLVVDKRAWSAGPWMTEPDRVQWQHAGYACLMVRHPDHGFWCGYVGVDRVHPLYGVDWRGSGAVQSLDAHRGVNYSNTCDGEICHVPEAGMPDDVWWFGFDCGHSFDYAPARDARMRALEAHSPGARALRKQLDALPLPRACREVYRPLGYVKGETESLAEQLRALASAGGVGPG